MYFMGRGRYLHLLTALALSLPMTAWPQGASIAVQETADGESHFSPEEQAVPQQSMLPQRRRPPVGTDTAARVLYWNQAMLNANGRDHTPGLPDQVFGEQLGPHRTSRAFAIVQIAVFDAINAVRGGYDSYTGLGPARPGASIDAAVALAAHDTLSALYPSQRPIFLAELAADLERIPDGKAKIEGSQLGQQAARAILALRENDGSQRREPVVGIDFFPSDQPGKWRPDPISMSPLALGAYWGKVRPFVIKSSEQFDEPAAPPLTSRLYTEAFNEAKRLGGDGVATPTERNRDQTVAGIYWGYDGTPGLGTPPRLYNQIAVQLAEERGMKDALKLARLLALLNISLADAAITIWDTKYDNQFWRPITAIREADTDDNPATLADPQFTPLGAQASNLSGPDFTPPFPAYTSGHAGLGGSLFQTLREFFGTDRISFTFVSDEWNGVTRDSDGRTRPFIPRSFSSLSEAEEENGQSRIYLGVHWRFDKTRSIALGRCIANYVYNHALRPSEYQAREQHDADGEDTGPASQ